MRQTSVPIYEPSQSVPVLITLICPGAGHIAQRRITTGVKILIAWTSFSAYQLDHTVLQHDHRCSGRLSLEIFSSRISRTLLANSVGENGF